MFKLIFRQFKLDTILFVGISLMDTFLKISAIALFIPLLEYMQGGGNIDLSLVLDSNYWVSKYNRGFVIVYFIIIAYFNYYISSIFKNINC